jgi:hypothetical protein
MLILEFSAESVAEFTKRPLYAVSSGELGTEASELEDNLARILDVATVWKAVLLLDEADVFLEARSLHDVNRNALVSTFLRLLEVKPSPASYHDTTDRKQLLVLRGHPLPHDKSCAVIRRGVPVPYVLMLATARTFLTHWRLPGIHVALKYNDLSASSRRIVWSNFLAKLGPGRTDLSEADYDALEGYDLNGRQIKNAVKTAKSLADSLGGKVTKETLESVLDIQRDFQRDFKQAVGTKEAAEEAT